MYRGITLTPVISKTVWVSATWALQWLFDKWPSPVWFQENSSCNRALFTFVESIKYFTKRGSKVHCAFLDLDVSKAFDKVKTLSKALLTSRTAAPAGFQARVGKNFFNDLFAKLIDRKFPYHFVFMLYNWYRNLSCAVVWNRLLVNAFQLRCGVRQGGILSPYLFAIYIDDIVQLRNSGYGSRIGNIFAGLLLYADNIALLSCSCCGLQKLINICCLYGKMWDIKFNPVKSQVITFGADNLNP